MDNELSTVFGDEAPPLRTVQRWSEWFRDGREDIEDEERAGRPIAETATENIQQIQDLINDDPYITVNELKRESGISHGIIQRIISTSTNMARKFLKI